jgi:hypothetical protein
MVRNSEIYDAVNDVKLCKRCEKTKPVSEFYRQPKNHDRYHSICKVCHAARREGNLAKRSAELAINPITEFRCRDCKLVKPIDQFGSDSKKAHCRKSRCKPCHAAYHRKLRKRLNQDPRYRAMIRQQERRRCVRRTAGITLDDYNALLASQGGVCAICGKPETTMRLGTLRELAVDHCHVTGKVRGLLCSQCNHGLGNYRDNPELLRKAAEYLECHNK